MEHLEAEVTGLLGLLEELASNLPPGPFSPKPDLLGDGEWLRCLLDLTSRVPGCRRHGVCYAVQGRAPHSKYSHSCALPPILPNPWDPWKGPVSFVFHCCPKGPESWKEAVTVDRHSKGKGILQPPLLLT